MSFTASTYPPNGRVDPHSREDGDCFALVGGEQLRHGLPGCELLLFLDRKPDRVLEITVEERRETHPSLWELAVGAIAPSTSARTSAAVRGTAPPKNALHVCPRYEDRRY